MSEMDTSKMSRGKAEAMEVAEAARQTEWENPSFAAQLFMGRYDDSLVWPYPAQPEEDQKIGAQLLAPLEVSLKKKVAAAAIAGEQDIPADVIKGLGDLGLFAMKIPKQYGGL